MQAVITVNIEEIINGGGNMQESLRWCHLDTVGGDLRRYLFG